MHEQAERRNSRQVQSCYAFSEEVLDGLHGVVPSKFAQALVLNHACSAHGSNPSTHRWDEPSLTHAWFPQDEGRHDKPAKVFSKMAPPEPPALPTPMYCAFPFHDQ